MFKSLLVSSLLLGAGLCQRGRTRTQPITQPTAQPTPQGTIQSMWGQCGGREYTGLTACPTSAYCMNDGVNEWYSQCVPFGTEDSDTGDDNIITTTIGTVFSVGGPTPTVVTTFITILAPSTTQNPTSVTTITLVPDDPFTPRAVRTAGSS